MNKRIDFIVSEYSNLSAPEFVKAVLNSYYNHYACEYDSTHPDIYYDAAAAWEKIFGVLNLKIPDSSKYAIVDIGCGTGFVAGTFLKSGFLFREYIGFEPSEKMRSVARKKFKDARLRFEPLDILENNVMFDAIGRMSSRKIIVLNSTLHHIVWWEDFLKNAKNRMSKNDLLVLCHEPNARFWKNKTLVNLFDMIANEKTERGRAFLYLNPLRYLKKIRSSKPDLINMELFLSNTVKKSLPANVINAIIDYSVPLCWRGITVKEGYDEGFYSAESLIKNYFYDMESIVSFTYQHLGFSPEVLSVKWREQEKILEKQYPLDGAQFCLAVKKPA